MGQNRALLFVSWFIGSIWLMGSAFLWWRLGFDGLQAITINDIGIFGAQSLKVDLTVAIAALLAASVFLRALLIKGIEVNSIVALLLTGFGVILCASTNQFWYFSVGIFFFVSSNLCIIHTPSLQNLPRKA